MGVILRGGSGRSEVVGLDLIEALDLDVGRNGIRTGMMIVRMLVVLLQARHVVLLVAARKRTAQGIRGWVLRVLILVLLVLLVRRVLDICHLKFLFSKKKSETKKWNFLNVTRKNELASSCQPGRISFFSWMNIYKFWSAGNSIIIIFQTKGIETFFNASKTT